MGPEVLLFDEPTAGLDPKTESFLIRLILQLTAAGKTIVTATQDLRLAAAIADRVIVLGKTTGWRARARRRRSLATGSCY